MTVIIDSLNLSSAESKLCAEALHRAGSIVDAANLLGITRHALKRRIIKHEIEWPLHSPLASTLAPIQSKICEDHIASITLDNATALPTSHAPLQTIGN